jgi:hypothetical protein
MGYVMLSKKGTDGTYTAIRTNTFDAGFVGGVEGSSAGITATVPAYTVALDSGDYKFVIYSKIAISVFDSTDLDLLARCDVATGLSITIDPTAYSSIFCGNGFAFGTSGLQHFLALVNDDKMYCECIAGNTGLRLTDGELQIYFTNAWYKITLDSSTGYLKATKV